jgi:hypothetical protein
LREKLEKEQALGDWTYEVAAYTLNSVLKDRTELLKQEEEPPAVDESTPIPFVPTEEASDE